mgnify:CR=1 FL=1
MKVGDLVIITMKEAKVPGALSAVKLAARLDALKDTPGIILKLNGRGMAQVQFPDSKRHVHVDYLEVISA